MRVNQLDVLLVKGGISIYVKAYLTHASGIAR